LNPVSFTFRTCSTLGTLVSPLIGLSSKHQNPQESFQLQSNPLQSTKNASKIDGNPDVFQVGLPGISGKALALESGSNARRLKELSWIGAALDWSGGNRLASRLRRKERRRGRWGFLSIGTGLSELIARRRF
jgi:hypothetical protein